MNVVSFKKDTSNEKELEVICDIETNGWIWNVTTIWCIVCKDIVSGNIYKWRPDEVHLFPEWFNRRVKKVIGHNFIGYDSVVLKKLLELDIPLSMIVDTLVLSRLTRPVSPPSEQAYALKTDNRIGGHSMDAWGTRLGFPKLPFKSFDSFSEEMLVYCVNDVELNYLIYLALKDESQGFKDTCIILEHKVARMLGEQEENGFSLDKELACSIVERTENLIFESTKELQSLFPPKLKPFKENWEPRYNKDGTVNATSVKTLQKFSTHPDLALDLNSNGSYNLYTREEFNPGSSTQKGERLLDLGWVPSKLTPTGKPATDKDTLLEAIASLKDYPEVKSLANYEILTDRNQKAKKWLELSDIRGDGKVHGKVNPIGAGTHRCSHFDDNMANIASVVTKKIPKDVFISKYGLKTLKEFEDLDNDTVFLHDDGDKVSVALKGLEGGYGWDSRSCWKASNDDYCIVGADASGIQLRALAHYMNDPIYIENLIKGDIHTVHQQAAGIATRDKAKTFIYAWLLGAGDEKIGTIVGVTEEEFEELISYSLNKKNSWGKPLLDEVKSKLKKSNRKFDKKTACTFFKGAKVKEQFLERTPALKRLKTIDIPEATKQGYLEGLDGRKLWIPSEHLAMSLYLQGFEAVIMKYSMMLYQDKLKDLNIDFKQVAFVHDEFQIETKWESAELVGKCVKQAIAKAGRVLGSNCPLDGEYKIGRSWGQTH